MTTANTAKVSSADLTTLSNQSVYVIERSMVESVPAAAAKYDKLSALLEAEPLEFVENERLSIVAPRINEYLVSIGELIDAGELDDYQVVVNPVHALGIACDIAKVGKLLRQINISYKPEDIDEETGLPFGDAQFRILGGRNRSCAILTLGHLSGYDINSEEFRSVLIPVSAEVQNEAEFAASIIADNTSRAVRPAERTLNKARVLDVDTSDLQSLAAAFAGRQLSVGEVGTLTFNLLFEAEPIDGLNLQLQTVSDIGKAALTYYDKTARRAHAKIYKTAEYQLKLYALLWDGLLEAVERVRKQGITNVARDGKLSVAQFIAKNAFDVINAEVSKDVKATKAKTKKVEAEPEVVEEPAAHEAPATEEPAAPRASRRRSAAAAPKPEAPKDNVMTVAANGTSRSKRRRM